MTKIMLVLMLCSSAADFASTEYGLAGGAIEANPLMKNRGVRIATAVGIPLLIYAITRERPKLAKWTVICYVTGKSAIAGRNIYIGVRVRWGKT